LIFLIVFYIFGLMSFSLSDFFQSFTFSLLFGLHGFGLVRGLPRRRMPPVMPQAGAGRLPL
jgi:hypothetical protein